MIINKYDWCSMCLKICNKTYNSLCCEDYIICLECYKTYLHTLHESFSNTVLCPFCKADIITYIIILDILKDVYNDEKDWACQYINNLIQFFTFKESTNQYMKNKNNFELC